MADITLDDNNFAAEVEQEKSMPVVVDFWAPWCGPCKIVSPTIEALAADYAGKVKVGKINVDDNPNTASKYGVMSLPSVFIYKNGQPVKSLIGAQGKENYQRAIEEVLAS